jgi:hypothetical protein
VRASLPASASRAANGDSSGRSLANRTFHGHTSWDVWRYTRFVIRLETGRSTLAGRGASRRQGSGWTEVSSLRFSTPVSAPVLGHCGPERGASADAHGDGGGCSQPERYAHTKREGWPSAAIGAFPRASRARTWVRAGRRAHLLGTAAGRSARDDVSRPPTAGSWRRGVPCHPPPVPARLHRSGPKRDRGLDWGVRRTRPM